MPAPATRRGTTNRNSRGSSAARRRRRQWLVDEFGNGATVVCYLGCSRKCHKILTVDTVWADRYPLPGCQGGRYTKDNIQPACGPCNMMHGGKLGRSRQLTKGKS